MLRIVTAVIWLLAAASAVPGPVAAGAAGAGGRFQTAGLTVCIYCKKPERREPPGDGYAPAVPTQLGEIAEELLKMRCTPDQNQAARYADIYFFRNLAPLGLSPAQEAQLTAAIMAQDGATAKELTASLRQDQNPQARLVADLVTLFAWGRTGEPLAGKEAQELFAALESGGARSNGMLRADYTYLRALAALEAGDKLQALKDLDDALGAEPEFFNAHVIRVAILVDLAEQAMLQNDATCLAAYDELAKALKAIMKFSPCALQAAHLAQFLRSRQPLPSQNAPLLVTELFLATVSQQKSAFDAKSRQLVPLVDGKARCGRHILNSVADLNRKFEVSINPK